MSRGTPHTQVRIGADLLQRILSQIAQRNYHSPEAPWTLSDFLRVAAEEKLSHMARSRVRPRKQPKGEEPVNATEPTCAESSGRGQG